MNGVVPCSPGFNGEVHLPGQKTNIGPTAKATGMIVPAILANSRNEEYPAWIAESHKPLSLETFFSEISSLQRRPDEESSLRWIKLAAVAEHLSGRLPKLSSR